MGHREKKNDLIYPCWVIRLFVENNISAAQVYIFSHDPPKTDGPKIELTNPSNLNVFVKRNDWFAQVVIQSGEQSCYFSLENSVSFQFTPPCAS